MPLRPAHAPLVCTVGHSNRTLDDFLELMAAHGVTRIVDVRKLPGSRAYPHFNREALAASLAAAGIDYRHEPRLGGRRAPQPDSPNTGWKNRSFQAFADYMQTPEFDAALGEVIAEAASGRPALMCAEAVPWRCHRGLIADALTARGVPVRDIMTPQRADPHTLKAFAHVEEGRVTYPPPPEEPTLF